MAEDKNIKINIDVENNSVSEKKANKKTVAMLTLGCPKVKLNMIPPNY